MGRYIPDEIVEEVRQRNEISSVISSYLPLKRSGRNFKALCPFHTEKSPSFHINTEKQIFHCFGCGKGGNVFTFVMEIDRLEFPEAVRHLAHRAGVSIPETASYGGPEGETRKDDRERLYRANEWACSIFQESLNSSGGEPARAYLAGRGISPESIKTFRLGWAPDSWDTLVRKLDGKRSGLQALEKGGLVIRKESDEQADRYYDRFRGRVLFPIIDLQGRVVGFGARALDGAEPKYLNSPETPIFNKSRTLYGLPQAKEQARKSGQLVLTEGYTDVILAHQSGLQSFVAGLGTALTAQHVTTLHRYADEVVVLYDGDEAGRRAANRAVELFMVGEMPARFAALPAGEDPGSLLATGGAEAVPELEAILTAAKNPLDFMLDFSEPDGAAGGLEKRASLVDDILTMFAHIPSAVKKELYIKQLAEKTGLGEPAIRDRLAGLNRSRARVREADGPPEPETFPALDTYLLEIALLAPELRKRIGESGVLAKLTSRSIREACERLLAMGPEADVTAIISQVENPALGSLIAGLCDRVDSPSDYPKALDDCLRRIAQQEATIEGQSLSQALAREVEAGDEARQIELLKEIHRVSDSRIRSIDG